MIALLFPGQGAQYVGMGQTLAQRFPVIKARFQEADQFFSYTGHSLIKIMGQGPLETLMQTQWAQPALFTLSCGLFDVVYQHCLLSGFSIGWVAGHSLGEYSALYAAGCFSFQEGLLHIKARCQAMAEVQDGTMAAILKLPISEIYPLLECYGQGQVELANDNCPGQVVISGKKEGVQRILGYAQSKGARCVPLQVSGPFHSSFMAPAAEKFAHYLQSVTFASPSIPIITNVSGAVQKDPDCIKNQLIQHLSLPVRWRESLQTLHALGAKYYLELGAGSVITGLVRKTLDSVYATSLGDLSLLEDWMHSTEIPSVRAMQNL
ncbi:MULTISPECIES: ACP S-malonyltransferase [Holospora]|uniref:Malonyl CoA-acyl carrier protein transacylase n=2 Tax=Holospora TaxID=44747 RepID=A0A061JGY2_9PROT|nr:MULTISPECIES: ACP S-malonyltransferase [Holospora]ETZ05416.1 malonyl CoA-acyl carrier protein transacylase [Holospora undulata HU1]GAJ46151.1 malonyl CoA-acyl carrier protein transacylase [Holospora elegans E1]